MDPNEFAPSGTSHTKGTVIDGVVQIELGRINPIEPELLADPNLYLSVEVDRNPEMFPRLKLEAVLRAQWARHAQDVSGEVINPASVQINGIEVIDSRGTWVGGGEMGGGGGETTMFEMTKTEALPVR